MCGFACLGLCLTALDRQSLIVCGRSEALGFLHSTIVAGLTPLFDDLTGTFGPKATWKI